MPELPEVETVRCVLEKCILNKKIINVDIIYEGMIENDVNYFKEALINNTIISLQRRGKYLIFELPDYYLISHLRMEGKYYYRVGDTNIDKHEHVRICFDDDSYLVYHDTRKFGKMKIITKDFIEEYFAKLGVEPNNLTTTYLHNKLIKSNKCIKTLLLDQSIIAGLGNIYANEVLFASNINPFKSGKNINIGEVDNIINTSRSIINKAISCGGTTIKSYTSSLGVSGTYQNYLQVHMKEKELCTKCMNNLILKDRIDGRSVYYCPNCQGDM